jgi:hypothetical protein
MAAPLSTLPAHLRPLFWDAELETVDPSRHMVYIVERVVELGDDRAISWLLRTVERGRIREVIRTSRSISRNTARFWSLLLEIPQEDIRCLSRPLPRVPLVYWS